MTLKKQEASQASLEWVYLSRWVKRSNIGGYKIQVSKIQDRKYRYEALHLLTNLLIVEVGDDRNLTAGARDKCVVVCNKHYQLAGLRCSAYAAVGGVLLAKYGHCSINLLSANQLMAVINNPKCLVKFVGGGS